MIASTSGNSLPNIHAARTVSPSIRNALRAETSVISDSSVATPNPRVASPFQSERSGISMPSVSAQEACDQGESREMPNGRTPAAARSALLSRRSSISFVQPADQSKK
jgi:hypothetical protein